MEETDLGREEGAKVIRLAARAAAFEPAFGGGGGSVEDMNREFAVVLVGGKVAILRERPDARLGGDRVSLMSVDAFKEWVRPRKLWKTDQMGTPRPVSASSIWLGSAERRTYEGMVFEPGDREVVDGAFNLWRGFSVAANAAGDPEPWIEHVRDNVCSGSEELFSWVAGWFAAMLQRPRQRNGTALALRGGQGAGKTIVGEIVGRLVEAHYLLVENPRYLTGQFNAHLAQTLFLQADEAFWSGDKATIGQLKGLITSRYQMIEHKGVDPIRVSNYVHLMASSNEDWVVPAGRDERRWAVIDVGEHRKQDSAYFGALSAHFDEPKHLGGLLHYLLTLPLSDVDLRAVPKTRALYEQKIRSMEPHEAWWLERLMEGSQLPGEGAWREAIERHRLYAAYIADCERVGVRRRMTVQEFGVALKRLTPDLGTAQPRLVTRDENGFEVEKRVRCYLFQPVAVCRAWFEAAVGQSIDWEDPPG